MKNLTPYLSHPVARARVGEMCEQVRADRDRKRHPAKPWWKQAETDVPPPGCGAMGIVGLIVIAVTLIVKGALILIF